MFKYLAVLYIPIFSSSVHYKNLEAMIHQYHEHIKHLDFGI